MLIKLGLPMSFFLVSFSLLFFSVLPSGWLIWSVGALWDHLPSRASKTHSRRCLRWGTFSYSRGRLRPTWTEQVPCCAGALLAFCVNQGISASFLSSIFLTAKFFPYLFLYFSQSPTPSSQGNPWIQTGWTPANNYVLGTSLVVQGLRFQAVNAGDRIWCLAWELDPICPN